MPMMRTDGEVNERVWSHVNMFFKALKEMKSCNRRVVLEDVLHFLWERAQYQAPSVIAKKLLLIDSTIDYLTDSRSDISLTDLELKTLAEMTKSGQNFEANPPEVNTFEEAQILILNDTLKKLQRDVWMLIEMISRRFADASIS
jgi:hypothetical protein